MNNLVISSITNSVFYNGVGVSNLQNLAIPSNIKSLYWDESALAGWIENIDSQGNYIGNTEITILPSWAENCLAIFKTATLPATPTPTPTPKQICQNQAKNLLLDTDWSEIPSVSNTQNTPYLLNLSDFINYRVILRNLIVNPVDNPVFPTKPTTKWSS